MGGDIGNFFNNVTDALGATNHAGDRATSAQQAATDQSNATLLSIYNQNRADAAPWRQAGAGALSGLAANDFMKDWQQDPGYQFRMSEGQKSINNAAAARGMGNSGATLKALTQYGQDLASQEYGNIYNREYNRLSGIAGIGNSANTNLSNLAQNYGNSVAQNQIGMGNAYGANYMGAVNRMSGMGNSFLTGIGQAIGSGARGGMGGG